MNGCARVAVLVASAALLAAAAARADIVHMTATIDVAQEVPASSGTGSGSATITVDTQANTLTYHVQYTGLTSPEVAAHIHGPAAPGEVSFSYLYWFPLGSSKDGVWNYPENLEADILGGRTYINVHTQTWNTGEIRGQIVQSVPAAERAGYLLLALALLVAGAWFRLRSARRVGTFAAIVALLSLVAWKTGDAATTPRARAATRPAASTFRAVVDHPFFPLVPGTVFTYRETEDGRTLDEVVTVMREPRVVAGVRCVVVHDVVKHGDALVEDTYDWYAQDAKGSVWYFGEDTKEYGRDGQVHTGGSWEAGIGGAEPGVLMPAAVKPGPEYRQEYSPGVAEDMGQIEAVGDTVQVPAGRYTGCVRTRDWSRIESGVEHKWYARGVGFVRSRAGDDETCELLSVERP